MAKNMRYLPWTTLHECRFLTNLGSFSSCGNRCSKAKLLRHYIKAARKRKEWGAIDRDEVLAHAHTLLHMYRYHEDTNPKKKGIPGENLIDNTCTISDMIDHHAHKN